MKKPPPPCSFAGYVSQAGGKLVQDWYDFLPTEEHDELLDTVNHLASMPVTSWRRPEFDKIDAPLYEIRCKANKANHEIRVYGAFDPKVRGRFILLHGNEAKKKDEDTAGKAVALKRWALLENGKASTHEFVFEEGID
jgi:hypothetical protein